MDEKISDKIVQLRLASRKACMCESAIGSGKNTLSLKSKFLYCIKEKRQSPNMLMSKLLIGKTNLAILAKGMVRGGLVLKIPSETDKRQIQYEITDAGREYLQKRLDIIERAFKNILTDEKEYTDALRCIEDALSLLSYL